MAEITDAIRSVLSVVVLPLISIILSGKLLNSVLLSTRNSEDFLRIHTPIIKIEANDQEMTKGFVLFIVIVLLIGLLDDRSFIAGMQFRMGLVDAPHWQCLLLVAAMFSLLSSVSALSDTQFVPIGDFQQIFRDSTSVFARNIKFAMGAIRRATKGFVVVDCRGGIDVESLAVCESANQIIVITETDAASIQATQNLVNILSENGLLSRIAGFAINKAFDDPSQIAQAGTSLYRSSYLGPIPFDLATTRDFIKGELPETGGVFLRHVSTIVSKLNFTPRVSAPSYPIWTQADYSRWSRSDERVIRGERFSTMFYAVMFVFAWAILLVEPTLVLSLFGDILPSDPFIAMDSARALGTAILGFLIALSSYGILTNSDPVRRYIGRFIEIVLQHKI